MNNNNKQNDISQPTIILRQETGQFNARFAIGPARWDFWDLLWLHKGQLDMTVNQNNERLKLHAPSGILIPPGTNFMGRAVDETASASITHFESSSGGKMFSSCLKTTDCMSKI